MALDIGSGERARALLQALLARDVFVQKIAELSKKMGKNLPKGGGAPVDVAARELVIEQGEAAFGQVAKLHFRNAARALGQPEPPR